MATPLNLQGTPPPAHAPLQVPEAVATASPTSAFNNDVSSISSAAPDKGCLCQVFDAVTRFFVSLWENFCSWICPQSSNVVPTPTIPHSSSSSTIATEVVPTQPHIAALPLPVVDFGSSIDSPKKNLVLKQHKPEYTQLIMDVVVSVNKDVAGIIADYVVEDIAFGKEKWKERYGVDIGKEPPLPVDDFYKYYHGKNPVDVMNEVAQDKIRQVCESRIAPYIRPERVTHIASGEIEDYCLNVLGSLVEHPQEGHPSRYQYEPGALRQHGATKARPSTWVVPLEDVVARNESWDEQVKYLEELNATTGANCTTEPAALTVATGVFQHQNVTGERVLGDRTGVEQRSTYCRTIEKVRYGENGSYHAAVGGNAPLVAGVAQGPGPSGGLIVHDFLDYDVDYLGVWVLREFQAIEH